MSIPQEQVSKEKDNTATGSGTDTKVVGEAEKIDWEKEFTNFGGCPVPDSVRQDELEALYFLGLKNLSLEEIIAGGPVGNYVGSDYHRAMEAQQSKNTAQKIQEHGDCEKELEKFNHDIRKALRLVERAAEGGYLPAQHRLGHWYEIGFIVPQNLTTAEKIFHRIRAREQNHDGAKEALAPYEPSESAKTSGQANAIASAPAQVPPQAQPSPQTATASLAGDSKKSVLPPPLRVTSATIDLSKFKDKLREMKAAEVSGQKANLAFRDRVKALDVKVKELTAEKERLSVENDRLFADKKKIAQALTETSAELHRVLGTLDMSNNVSQVLRETQANKIQTLTRDKKSLTIKIKELTGANTKLVDEAQRLTRDKTELAEVNNNLRSQQERELKELREQLKRLTEKNDKLAEGLKANEKAKDEELRRSSEREDGLKKQLTGAEELKLKLEQLTTHVTKEAVRFQALEKENERLRAEDKLKTETLRTKELSLNEQIVAQKKRTKNLEVTLEVTTKGLNRTLDQERANHQSRYKALETRLEQQAATFEQAKNALRAGFDSHLEYRLKEQAREQAIEHSRTMAGLGAESKARFDQLRAQLAADHIQTLTRLGDESKALFDKLKAEHAAALQAEGQRVSHHLHSEYKATIEGLHAQIARLQAAQSAPPQPRPQTPVPAVPQHAIASATPMLPQYAAHAAAAAGPSHHAAAQPTYAQPPLMPAIPQASSPYLPFSLNGKHHVLVPVPPSTPSSFFMNGQHYLLAPVISSAPPPPPQALSPAQPPPRQ